ncbi:MAG: LPS assembly protein LptD [Rhodobacteraceae bacterium]|nr:LPS assembly protein LptD [Paracoccaceae bacterium]
MKNRLFGLLSSSSLPSLAVITALAGLPASPVTAQTFTPAPPDASSVLDRQNQKDEREDALREVLNLNGDEANGPVTLEADSIEYQPAGQVVIANGDVQIFFGGRALQADMIIYSGKQDKITATGNIKVINADGSVLVADAAEFDSEIRNGLIKGAKAVLADGQARMAAVEARRVDGKYTQLSKAVFSPCNVCELDPTPLWRIRARKIIQDEEARDIVYEDATFEVFGQPVAWLPSFRHPDPTVKRRSGFLPPEFGDTDDLGFSARASYFYDIAPNRDLTVGLYAFTEETPVLEGEYRGVLQSGEYDVSGSITHSSDSAEEGFRGHFDGDGRFALGMGHGFDVGFDAVIASDDTYLRRYRYSSEDRVETRLFAERFQEDGFVSAEAIRYQSFRNRDEDDNGTNLNETEFAGQIPLVAPMVEFEQKYDAPLVGGDFTLGGDTRYLRRTSGRDVSRVSGSLGWRRGFTNQFGVLLDATASVRADAYATFDDPEFDDSTETRVLPLASMTASWPLGKQTNGASHVIEPIASMVWSPYGGNPDEIPNEDSQDTELDDLSIFSINRFSGLDRWEDGPRATVGMRYNRFAIDGTEVEATIGQSFRLRESNTFSEGSGLNDVASDYVGAWRVSTSPFFTVGQRFRVSDEFEIERNEIYGSAEFFERFRVSSSYVFLDADPEAGADQDRTEANFAAAFDLTENWTIAGDVRRDFEESRFVTAGGAVRYANECCEVDFTIRRRFNDVDDVPESTDFGLVVRLKGLGTP